MSAKPRKAPAGSTAQRFSSMSNTVTATVAVGVRPYGVAIRPDGAFAYVTNLDSDNVSVIDLASNTVTATIQVGFVGPRGVAVDPGGP